MYVLNCYRAPTFIPKLALSLILILLSFSSVFSLFLVVLVPLLFSLSSFTLPSPTHSISFFCFSFFYPADKNSLAVPTAFPTLCSSFPQTRNAGNGSELRPHPDRRKPEHRIAILVSSSGFSYLPFFSFLEQDTDGVFSLMRCRGTA